MPGVLSNLFGDDNGDNDQTETSTQSYDASADSGLDLSPTISVGHEASGEYQNLDGSTTSWSSDTDVTLNVDVAATLGVDAGYDQTDA